MPKKYIALIVVAFVIADLLFTHLGATSSTTGSRAPSAGSQPSASATAATHPSSGPSATPNAARPVASPANTPTLEDDIGAMAQPRPLHVIFDGTNNTGLLHFDVVTDGKGNLTGTYSMQGQTVQLIVIGRSIYMKGPAQVMEWYTSIPASQVSSWVVLPSAYDPDILGTVATARLMSACMDSIANAYSIWAAETVPPDAPPVSGDVTWIRAVEAEFETWAFATPSSSGGAPIVAFNFLNDGSNNQDSNCNDGVTYVYGGDGGAKGYFTFASAGAPAISPPAGAVSYPIEQQRPDGDTGT